MTEKVLDWLNHNRFRAYPFINDIGLVCGDTRVPDCVLLDCVVMDTRYKTSISELVFTEIDITESSTTVYFKYDEIPYSYELLPSVDSAPETDNPGIDPSESSIIRVDGTSIAGFDNEFIFIKLVFSSHDYIYKSVGPGSWHFNGKVLPSKIANVRASGVMGLNTNGSKYVEGFASEGTAIGAVSLTDGYRTQPVIQNGKVVVKVGVKYGEDPCHYRENDQAYAEHKKRRTNCDELMFFFCGQNAVNSGNVILEGGPGVNIKQGGKYTAKYDIIDTYGKVGVKAGESLPCIEVVATPSLLKMYRPTVPDEEHNEEQD